MREVIFDWPRRSARISGNSIVPSASWQFSISATVRRGRATPEPLMVNGWRIGPLPPLRQRRFMRRDWYWPKQETDETSSQRRAAGAHSSMSYVLALAEERSPVQSSITRYGRPSKLDRFEGVGQNLLQFGKSGIGRADSNQLHLVELMDSKQAASIGTGCPGFAPKTGCVGGKTDRQIFFGEHLVGMDVGERDLGGGDKPEAGHLLGGIDHGRIWAAVPSRSRLKREPAPADRPRCIRGHRCEDPTSNSKACAAIGPRRQSAARNPIRPAWRPGQNRSAPAIRPVLREFWARNRTFVCHHPSRLRRFRMRPGPAERTHAGCWVVPRRRRQVACRFGELIVKRSQLGRRRPGFCDQFGRFR